MRQALAASGYRVAYSTDAGLVTAGTAPLAVPRLEMRGDIADPLAALRMLTASIEGAAE